MPLKKFCLVPCCGNNSKKCPDKLFFLVPYNLKRRKRWLQAMNRTDPISRRSSLHVCEDHFDLQNDMVSYMKYKMVGGNLKLKRNVVPHKLECLKSIPDAKRVEFVACEAMEMKITIEDFEDLLNSKYEPPDDKFNRSDISDDYCIKPEE